MNQFEGHEPVELQSNPCGICFITEETDYLQPLFDECEKYPWFYQKNKVSNAPSKIMFNDEDNLNFFIYFTKDEKPDFKRLRK